MSQSLVNEGRFPHYDVMDHNFYVYRESQSLVNEGRFPLVIFAFTRNNVVRMYESQSLVNEGRFPHGQKFVLMTPKKIVAIPR